MGNERERDCRGVYIMPCSECRVQGGGRLLQAAVRIEWLYRLASPLYEPELTGSRRTLSRPGYNSRPTTADQWTRSRCCCESPGSHRAPLPHSTPARVAPGARGPHAWALRRCEPARTLHRRTLIHTTQCGRRCRNCCVYRRSAPISRAPGTPRSAATERERATEEHDGGAIRTTAPRALPRNLPPKQGAAM